MLAATTPSSAPVSTPAARMGWMDMLRGVAVLLVVVMHAADIPMTNGKGVDEWSRLHLYLEPFRMPMLMFLSGLLLPRALGKTLPQYAWGKFAAIVWPALVWMLLFGFLIYHGGPTDPVYWRTGDYLWFLLALCACYGMAMLLKPVASRPVVMSLLCTGLFVAMILLRYHSEISQSLINRTLYYGAFFFLGAACAKLVVKWVNAPVSIVVGLGTVAVVLANLGLDDRSFRLGTPFSAATAILGIAVLLWVAPRVPRGNFTQILEWAGRNSIVIYVTHFPLVILIHRLMRHLDADPALYVSMCTVFGMALTLLMVRLRPWTAWLYVFPHHQRVAARLHNRAALGGSQQAQH
ncbi:acyltransferase family protein [Nesterenkonia massiliensis]|uniref:acyltransferase family protein n=1 Tax=Nesterenkonia massiliensis TaxID=1232429 RepID=UPI0004068B26|nr:acyltransferase [Nesterenkonia massiliensis]